MNEDRAMVAQAVLTGQIGEEYLTANELEEIELMVADIVITEAMLEAEDRGCSVFWGIDGGDTIQ